MLVASIKINLLWQKVSQKLKDCHFEQVYGETGSRSLDERFISRKYCDSG